MISVIFTARDAEEPLLRSLAALAPLATEGLIADVIVADLGSRDATLAVAEAAGCTLVETCVSRTVALESAIKRARKDWLLVLEAGDTPDARVATSLRDHIARHAKAPLALAFLALPPGAGRWRRFTLGPIFDASGVAPSRAMRLLVPRRDAKLLAGAPGLWRGARSRARIESAAMPSLRP
jgi:glycosyltransferase involved in cell wall biosynthesis